MVAIQLLLLNLSVGAVATSTTNVSVCSNQLPYNWNNQDYNASGTYSLTLVGSSGCDSIATLNLTVNSPVTSTTDVTICDSQLPYSWNNQTYNTGGTYSVLLTSSAGCDSVATLNLLVNPVLTSTTDVDVCSSQLPYSWNGQAYSTTGNYTVTLISSVGCDSIATLNLVVNELQTSTSDINICTNQLPYNWNGQTYNTPGTYTVMLTTVAGCDSVATLNLTASSFVTSTTNVSVCTNQLPYSWNNQDYNGSGTYSLTLVGSSGCDSIATLNLTVNSLVTSTSDITICDNQLPYLWNNQTYNTGGTYSVLLTSSAGCDSLATLNLLVNPVLTSTTDVAVCASQLPYSWNGQAYSITGNYTVTLISFAGCDSIATLNLVVNEVQTSTSDINICTNQLPYNWNGQTYNTPGTYNVLLTTVAGCDSVATLNLTASSVVTSTTNVSVCTNQLPYNWNNQDFNGSGTYSLTLVGSSGCDSIATLNLTVNSPVTSTTDVTICDNQLPYSWNNQTYNTGGTYSVLLTSSAGCDSVATLSLLVNPILTSTTDVAVCSSQLPYSWNGQAYSTTGIYNVALISASGCDSIATLNLVVNELQTSTSDINICTNQLPYVWNGQTYNTPGTYTVMLTTVAGCDSIATLNLTASSVVTSTTNVSVCSNQLPYSWNNQDYGSEGTYAVTLTGSSGCDSIATLVLAVNNTLTTTTSVSICNNLLPYSWNGNTYNSSGSYSITLTSTTGCDSVANLQLSVNNTSSTVLAETICENQLPYLWNGNQYNSSGNYTATLVTASGCDSVITLELTVVNTIYNNVTVNICSNQLPYMWNGLLFAGAGTFTQTFTAGNGCDSVVTLNLNVLQETASTTVVSVCSNQLPYQWNGQQFTAAAVIIRCCLPTRPDVTLQQIFSWPYCPLLPAIVMLLFVTISCPILGMETVIPLQEIIR
jgi:threonine/homoserine efflux transporter RhtA